ncbi:sulfatase, partial [Candidatus Bathyarchaeota archaeon]|nr:sulfatase [Candidatus Bathyarchaeota archaeon]
MTQPKKIILISIDTLRADHLGCYGYQRDTSPHIDQLAYEGVLFKYGFSPCSFTLPSHASLFTSQYPHHHSVKFDNNFGKLNVDSDITLSEILRLNKYKTAAFVGSMVLRHESRLDIGFDHYDDEMTSHEQNREDQLIRDGSETLNKAIQWIKDHLSDNFFIFLHFFDVHGPYLPPLRFKHLFTEDMFQSPKIKLTRINGYDDLICAIPSYQLLDPVKNDNGEIVSFEKDVSYYVTQYDACIRYTDFLIGELTRFLKNSEIYDDCFIILISDHGESFGENDIFFYHGLTVTPDQIRIPVIIKPSNQENYDPSIKEIGFPVSLVDIMPTILGHCGIEYT